MVVASILIYPNDSFEDWVVQEDGGRVLDHFASRETAELFAQGLARKRGAELVIQLPDGSTRHQSFAKSWIARWLPRWGP
jgi:hypothetical protein